MKAQLGQWFRHFLGRGNGAPITDPGLVFGGIPWAAGGKDKGRVRPNNEDQFLCDLERRLFVVADGMGGHAAGEEASSIAVETIDRCLTPEQISRVGNGDAQAVLSQVLEEASAAILGTAAARPEFKGMGSTAVVAVLADSTLHVCNVGDSRAYLIRGTEPSLLTVDHSVAAILAEMGNITPEEARSHPRRNELTASLGLERAVEPAYSAVPLQPGDRVVLCSDGLWDMLQDSEIACVSSDFTDPRTAVWDLIRAANEAGGHDNITAVVIFIGADCAKAEPLILQEEALPA